MLIVHHLANSRSQRVLWLLEELGIDYQVERHERDPESGLAPPALLSIHALGKSPVVVDNEQTLAETGAIVEYLIDRYGNGRLRPGPDSAELQTYRYWLHYAEGTFMPYMVMSLVVDRIESAPVPFFVKPVTRGIAKNVRSSFLSPNIERNKAFVEAHLANHSWFAGTELSGADFMMIMPLEALVKRGQANAENCPAIHAYVQKVHGLPAYLRALERGGQYDYGPS